MTVKDREEHRNRRTYVWIEREPIPRDESLPHSPVVSGTASPRRTDSSRTVDFTDRVVMGA